MVVNRDCSALPSGRPIMAVPDPAQGMSLKDFENTSECVDVDAPPVSGPRPDEGSVSGSAAVQPQVTEITHKGDEATPAPPSSVVSTALPSSGGHEGHDEHDHVGGSTCSHGHATSGVDEEDQPQQEHGAPKAGAGPDPLSRSQQSSEVQTPSHVSTAGASTCCETPGHTTCASATAIVPQPGVSSSGGSLPSGAPPPGPAGGAAGSLQIAGMNLDNCPQADPSHPEHASYLAMKEQISKFMSSGTNAEELMRAQIARQKEMKMNQLFVFVRNSGFDKLKAMVEANTCRPDAFPRMEDIATARDQHGHTFLHWGALGGDVEFCTWAVDEVGVPVETATFNGQTALMWATIHGNISIMRFLLSRGADLRRKDSLGATALLLAIQHKQKSAFLLIMNRDKTALDDVDINGCGAVHWASYKSDMAMLKFLDYFQCDFQAKDFAQMTCLHRAVVGGSFEVCEYLLKKKLNPYLKSKDGEDVLALAEKDKNNPYLSAALKEAITKHADPDMKQEIIPETTVIGAPDETGAPSPMAKDKKKQGFGKELQQMISEPDFQKYLIPCFYLAAATFALYVHVQYLSVVGPEAAPFLCSLVWFLVPGAILYFFYMMVSKPGTWPKRPIGRSAVEEIMGMIDSDEKWNEKKMARLCTECWILKDLRTKHCSVTNVCVREFDHYCGWLGTPIGRENNRQFVGICVYEFVAQLSHFLLIIYCVSAEAVKDTPDVGVWGIFTFTLTNYTLIAFSFFSHLITLPWLVCLSSYHLRLVAKNLTTNEVMNMNRYEHFWQASVDAKGQMKREFFNPWDKGGVVANCLDFWWFRKRGEFGPRGYCPVPMGDVELANLPIANASKQHVHTKG